MAIEYAVECQNRTVVRQHFDQRRVGAADAVAMQVQAATCTQGRKRLRLEQCVDALDTRFFTVALLQLLPQSGGTEVADDNVAFDTAGQSGFHHFGDLVLRLNARNRQEIAPGLQPEALAHQRPCLLRFDGLHMVVPVGDDGAGAAIGAGNDVRNALVVADDLMGVADGEPLAQTQKCARQPPPLAAPGLQAIHIHHDAPGAREPAHERHAHTGRNTRDDNGIAAAQAERKLSRS